MKVLQVIAHYMPAIQFGGALRVAHSLSRELIAAGHEVTICATNQRNPDSDLDVAVDEPVMVDGARVFYESVPFLRNWGFSPGLAWRTYRESASADVVLTHFHYQFASVIGGWCARAHRKPLMVFTHGSLNRHGMAAARPRLKRAYLSMFESANFRDAAYTVYHSDADMDHSLRLGSRNLIVPIGLDDAVLRQEVAGGEFRARHPKLRDRFLFGYLGRVSKGKGLEILLAAIAGLKAAGSDAALLIAGGDERGMLPELRAEANLLGIEDRVVFAGLLDDREKYLALADCDAFVLASRSEGTSVSALEAMSVGLPVIVTDRTGISRQVDSIGCGYSVPYDARAFEQAMVRMIAADDRAAMGARGRALVRAQHSWSAITARLVDDIKAVLPLSR
jgi:glycosyltransferase involved in cell wall biosynthesis